MTDSQSLFHIKRYSLSLATSFLCVFYMCSPTARTLTGGRAFRPLESSFMTFQLSLFLLLFNSSNSRYLFSDRFNTSPYDFLKNKPSDATILRNNCKNRSFGLYTVIYKSPPLKVMSTSSSAKRKFAYPFVVQSATLS